MKIIEITRDSTRIPQGIPSTFRLGEPVMEGGHTVKEILYCRDGYSGGSKGRFPSYAIKFEESSEVRVVPESEVVDMAVDPMAKRKEEAPAEAAVELPE
jgi:hypothetical protein